VLFLDADCYPIYDPDECFEPEHNPYGIVTWPDISLTDDAVHWPTYGITPDGKTGLNGGHYVFTKRQAWPLLQLASHYDNHSDYYYWRYGFDVEVGGFSDQEQIRAAVHKLGIEYHRYADRPLSSDVGVFIQAGPWGRPLFVHRVQSKFALHDEFPSPVGWNPARVPMEAIAWSFFLEWLTDSGSTDSLAVEVPGTFTHTECNSWQHFCSGRHVLELGRHLGQSTVAAALSARSVVSIDRTSAWQADLWLQRFGVRHKVWLREGDFTELVPTSGGPFSACLFEAAHRRSNVESDVARVAAHLSPGAVVGFHDFDDPAFPDVQSVLDEIAARRGWRLVERQGSLAVFVTPSSDGADSDMMAARIGPKQAQPNRSHICRNSFTS
jgi:hypothetical protein